MLSTLTELLDGTGSGPVLEPVFHPILESISEPVLKPILETGLVLVFELLGLFCSELIKFVP